MTKKTFIPLVCLLACLTCAGATPVEKHGKLRVEGRNLIDSKGNPTRLQGINLGWHCLWPRFYNKSTVKALAEDWNATVVRAAIGLDLENLSFEKKPQESYALLDSIVQGAVGQGIYVIVDFHSHANNLALAREFFKTTSAKYGKLPNVIYEIWNEPTEVAWSEIKDYAKEIVPVIRANAPDAVILVPTPRWDQDVDAAANDPLTEMSNIMYSLHYYAATHQDYFRDKARYALEKGLPIFISESAAMTHTGDGVIDPASFDKWHKLADDYNLSWIVWSISDKDETCSMLRPEAPSEGTLWQPEHIKPWGWMVRGALAKKAD